MAARVDPYDPYPTPDGTDDAHAQLQSSGGPYMNSAEVDSGSSEVTPSTKRLRVDRPVTLSSSW